MFKKGDAETFFFYFQNGHKSPASVSNVARQGVEPPRHGYLLHREDDKMATRRQNVLQRKKPVFLPASLIRRCVSHLSSLSSILRNNSLSNNEVIEAISKRIES